MRKSKILQEIGGRIRERRKSAGLTQEDLAHAAEIDRSYLGGIERGERNITVSILARICAALGCDIASLTGGIPRRLT